MKKYVFKPYSKTFPELFAREKARIAAHVKGVIEHIGSTAVPNLGGKGIIDIAIAVDKNELEAVSQKLQHLGYIFRPTNSTPDRLFLRADLPDQSEGVRRYHIHLTYPENKEWKDFLAFRDYLISHPEELQHYADLKKKAAGDVNEDGPKYRALKEPAFKQILQKTMEERIHFKPVDAAHRSLVHSWLSMPHAAEWFYGQGLKNTINHLDDFLKGEAQAEYWLGYDKDHPFAFLITSFVKKPDDEWSKYSLEDGVAITLDMLIGELNYLGKGLSTIIIRKFLQTHFPDASEVFIDPEATNVRAIHVYQKAGFKIIKEFIPSHSPHPHYLMRMKTKKS